MTVAEALRAVDGVEYVQSDGDEIGGVATDHPGDIEAFVDTLPAHAEFQYVIRTAGAYFWSVEVDDAGV